MKRTTHALGSSEILICKITTTTAYEGRSRRFTSSEFKRIVRASFLVPIVILAMAAAAHAQLSGLHVKGDAGLDSGTQAPRVRTMGRLSTAMTPAGSMTTWGRRSTPPEILTCGPVSD